MKYDSPPRLEGYYYSPSEAKEARDHDEIRSIRLETSLSCNLNCNYCYSGGGLVSNDKMSYETMLDAINQAKKMGAKSVVVIGGGEPTIYKNFKPLIEYIRTAELVPVIFTNNQTMTPDLARFLKTSNTSVIFKLDSLNEEVQDAMAGTKGAFKKIMQGLDNLKAAGYEQSKLGASFVVNRQNVGGIPDTWRYCRDNNIFPNLEMLVPNERAQNLNSLMLTRDEWKKLNLELLRIDRKEFGYDWLPHGPLIGCGCWQCLYNVYIAVNGDARPCPSVQSSHPPNIKNHSLKDVIATPFFKLARTVDQKLEGKCGDCTHNDECIGCRGLTFTTAVNKGVPEFDALKMEDPSCFRD